MKKYMPLILVFASFLSFRVLADDAAQKTDGSFWQNPKTIDSSFIGDTSKSTLHERDMADDTDDHTDSMFVGEGNTNAQNTYFAGDSYDEQVGNSTVQAFSGDSAFSGRGYGK